MEWVSDYQLFLFDFDGLLVDTEPVHYQAYCNMGANRGVEITWSFLQFLQYAHRSHEAIRDAIAAEYPKLFAQASWETLYQEKKDCYQGLLRTGAIRLMPGVEKLLNTLHQKKITSCVVTNSSRQQIDFIRKQIPALEKITHWITREEYKEAKPSPECYLQAIKRYGKAGDKIVGFEDSLRGIQALENTPAQSVLICDQGYPHLEASLAPSVIHYESLLKIPEKHLL